MEGLIQRSVPVHHASLPVLPVRCGVRPENDRPGSGAAGILLRGDWAIIVYQFREYPVTTRREAKLQGSWCQTPFIGAANGDCAREPTCHATGGGETMIAAAGAIQRATRISILAYRHYHRRRVPAWLRPALSRRACSRRPDRFPCRSDGTHRPHIQSNFWVKRQTSLLTAT